MYTFSYIEAFRLLFPEEKFSGPGAGKWECLLGDEEEGWGEKENAAFSPGKRKYIIV